MSWVRYRDIHLLTHGVTSYTDDRRFSAHMDLLTDTWQLRINNVTLRFGRVRIGFWVFLEANMYVFFLLF